MSELSAVGSIMWEMPKARPYFGLSSYPFQRLAVLPLRVVPNDLHAMCPAADAVSTAIRLVLTSLHSPDTQPRSTTAEAAVCGCKLGSLHGFEMNRQLCSVMAWQHGCRFVPMICFGCKEQNLIKPAKEMSQRQVVVSACTLDFLFPSNFSALDFRLSRFSRPVSAYGEEFFQYLGIMKSRPQWNAISSWRGPTMHDAGDTVLRFGLFRWRSESTTV